jgi:hypothetical protein
MGLSKSDSATSCNTDADMACESRNVSSSERFCTSRRVSI